MLNYFTVTPVCLPSHLLSQLHQPFDSLLLPMNSDIVYALNGIASSHLAHLVVMWLLFLVTLGNYFYFKHAFVTLIQ